MDEPVKVSIITPTFNHERFIGQCLESVLAQTYANWEQIIIDDGSDDNTEEIIGEYNDDRIIYTRQDNKGIWRLGETYNKALKHSKGELVAILEGDDFWPAHKLQRQLPTFSDPEVVLSWGRACITKSNRSPLFSSPKDVKQFINQSRYETLRKLLFQNPIISSTVICRKSALLSVGGFKQPEGLPYVDLPTWLALSRIGEFRFIDCILGYRRMHARQISNTMKAALNAGHRYPIEFFMQLPDEVKESIGIALEDLLAHLDHVNSEFFYQSGRSSLFERKWFKARDEFREALLKGCPTTRMKAVAGLVCSYFRIDVEWLTPITKEPRLEEIT